MENKLQERQELQDWINTFDTFVGKFDPNGMGIIFNETPLKVSGISEEEVVGKYFPDAKWWSHSKVERDRIAQCFEKAKIGVSTRIETNFRSADGSTVPIIFNCQPVMDEAGEVKYITAEGKTIVEEVRLRAELQEAKDALEIRVQERTIELSESNKRLKNEINVRRHSEEALRQSEEKYRSLTDDVLDSSAVGTFILDADFKVVWLNQSLERFFDLHRNNVIGKDKRKLIHKQIKKIFENPESFAKRVFATYDNNTYIENFECHVLPDGERQERWLEHWSQPIRKGLYAGGRIEHYYDISAAKEAEEHIRHLQSVLKAIRSVNQFIVREKDQKKLLQGACEILNQTRNYKFVWIGIVQEGSKNVIPVGQAGFSQDYLKSIKVTWDDADTGKGPTGTALKTGKPFIMSNMAEDPRYKPWRKQALKHGYAASAAIPLIYEKRVFGALNVYATMADSFDEEEISLLTEVGMDIAFALHNMKVEEKRQQAEAALRKSNEKLEAKVTERTLELKQANTRLQELDRLKSMFIASMSHELRTPLNSIIGFTGIILQGLTGEINAEQKDQLQRVFGSAQHLLDLINDVIDISKIEAGRFDIYPEEFSLDEVVDEAASTLSLEISKKELVLEISVPKDVQLKTDRKRVLQCILNYLSNASKFTERGTIRVSTRVIDEMVEISVQDTGIGIKQKDMPNLFTFFARLDSPLRFKTSGTGLGLYLTKKIATELLNGTVSAKSTYEQGSTFLLTIPKEIVKEGE